MEPWEQNLAPHRGTQHDDEPHDVYTYLRKIRAAGEKAPAEEEELYFSYHVRDKEYFVYEKLVESGPRTSLVREVARLVIQEGRIV